MTPPRLRAAGDTHAGLQRDNNEDRFFFDDRRGVFCVIDGVGGQLAGERAAEIAAATLHTRLTAANGASALQIRDALAAANDAIYDAAIRDRALHGMACVATVALADGERLRFGHVGDTRLFKIRDGAIAKLTHDHSPVGELEDSGALTEVDAMRHPRRNEIYRDLGSQPRQRDDPAFIEIGEDAFEADAALVLCSDGLSDLVSSGSVRRIVEAHAGSPALAVQELITAANDAGGKDNVTVVVVEGDRFAEAVATRDGRRAPAGAARPGPASPSAPAPVPVPTMSSSPPRSRARTLLAFVAGLVVGVAVILASQYAGWDLTRLAGLAGPSTATRTWRVGLDPAADFPTIAGALEAALAGDTVVVGPGEYREAIRLPEGVSVEGTRESILRPPLGAGAEWAAITVRGTTRGRIEGLLVASGADQPYGTGLVVEDAAVDVENLEIAGASTAGIELRAGARAAIRRSFVHDNPGPGVIVRAGAEPRLEFNVILHNGTHPGTSGPGVLVEAGATPRLVANGIGGNAGPSIAGWPAAGLAEVTRENALSPVPAPPVVLTLPTRRGAARNRIP